MSHGLVFPIGIPIADVMSVWSLESISFCISADHFSCFSGGSEIERLFVLITQPKTVLIPSKVPSALSFFAEIILTLGRICLESTGRAIVCIAHGMALITLVAFSPISGVMAILFSM